MKIYYTPRFERAYKKLPARIKNAAKESIGIFQKDPNAQRLNTHKLHGKMRGACSFSVTREYRIIFEYIEGGVVFLIIGNHKIYH